MFLLGGVILLFLTSSLASNFYSNIHTFNSSTDSQFDFPTEPQHAMGVRFTERGLTKFCQMGYKIIPEIIAQMPPFNLDDVSLGLLSIKISNVRPRRLEVSTMDLMFLDNGVVRMEARDGLMQLSMHMKASVGVISGSLNCVFTLRDFGADASIRIGDDISCPYHFGLFDASNKIYLTRLDMDLDGQDYFGSTIANILLGMAPALESLLKDTLLSALLDTVFVSLKKSMCNLPTILAGTPLRYSPGIDQRYMGGINLLSGKVVANQGGYTYPYGQFSVDPNTNVTPYIVPNESPFPADIYTARDYEYFLDRQALNSNLFVWQVNHAYYDYANNSIPYSVIRLWNIPEIAESLVNNGLLSNMSDPGKGVYISISVNLNKNAPPHIDWIGAAAMPLNITSSIIFEARKQGANNTTDLSITLLNLEAELLVSAVLDSQKYSFGFNNDQLKSSIKAQQLVSVNILKENGGTFLGANRQLIQHIVEDFYLSYFNEKYRDPGITLMNGNFINMSTITYIFLPLEQRILMVSDIEQNPHFLV